MTTLKIGTRGSALALWQANFVAEQLRTVPDSPGVEIVVIKTAGDLRQDVPLQAVAGRGVFVREIEAALLRGDIDLAVHSAKDLPSIETPGTTLAAFCARHDPRDALISEYGNFDSLPRGARVATSAPRRVAQLLFSRPDLNFVPIRGNVDTRLGKLSRGDADALILACAGLERLGRADVISEKLSPELCLPQVGQGCVAVQCRADDSEIIRQAAAACDYVPTRRAVVLERQFLALLGGGCTAPVAGHAKETQNRLRLTARVAAADGSKMLQAEGEAADQVYEDLLRQGARELLSVP